MLILQSCFYASFLFNAVPFFFCIFNNVEEIAVIRKRLLDGEGNTSIPKLTVLRLFVSIIAILPIFVLDDIFIFASLTGSIMSPTIGMLMPVS